VKTGEINFCNAGHNPPYILRKNGELQRLPNSNSTMLGVFDFMDFQDESEKLEEGDMLVMYTDGVDEACNVDNQEFTDERLELALNECVGLNCKESIEKVLSRVREFVGEAEQSDDITMLAIKKL
jgi:sigma-B regulation protein RsbU (phosphoserine phosphatase)